MIFSCFRAALIAVEIPFDPIFEFGGSELGMDET